MADGRRHWQRWLDQVVDSLGSLPFYDSDGLWTPEVFPAARQPDWRNPVALKQKPEPKPRLYRARNSTSEDGPSAA